VALVFYKPNNATCCLCCCGSGIQLVASFSDRPHLLKHEEKMHVYAARTSLGCASKTCSDHAHVNLHAASACHVCFDGIAPGYRSWPPLWPRGAMLALVKTRNRLYLKVGSFLNPQGWD